MSRETARAKRQRKNFEFTKPYTVERLQKAIRVFENLGPCLTKRGLRHRYHGNYLGSEYNIRVRQSFNLRDRKCWGVDTLDLDVQDDDKDANYQPRKEPSRKNKDKPVQQPSTSPQKLIVKLSLPSVKGKMLLHRLVSIDAFADFVDDDGGGETNQNNNGDDKYFCMQQSSEAVMRKIRTAFAHPIDCELGSKCDVPCKFCKDFTFGMFGLGWKDVKVIDYGTFFEEVEGGHREDGYEQTRMCNVCALKRLRVINCAGHEILSLQNFDPCAFDYQAAFDSLGSKDGRIRSKQVNPWCSFCINPAFFGCATIHFVDIFANDIDPLSSEAQGCGLFLCENCKALMDVHHNDIARVIRAIPRSEGVRADAEFLDITSNLNRYFNE